MQLENILLELEEKVKTEKVQVKTRLEAMQTEIDDLKAKLAEGISTEVLEAALAKIESIKNEVSSIVE